MRTIPRRARAAAIAAAAAGVLALSGCVPATDSSAGTLQLQSNGMVSTFDSAFGMSYEATSLINEGLYKWSPDNTAVLGLASDVEVSADQLTWTFTLRDAAWSDGESITAQDFEFGFKHLADPATGGTTFVAVSAGLANADAILAGEKDVDELGVHAVDDKTLVVTLDHPVPYLPSALADPYWSPISEAFFDEHADDYGQSPDTVLASGPFELASYDAGGNAYTLEKNPDYYDADSVELSTITFTTITDQSQALAQYQAGNLDKVVIDADQAAQLDDTSDLHSELSNNLYWLALNFDDPTIQNSALRRALAESVDRDTIADQILSDGSVPADYLVVQDFDPDEDGTFFRDDADASTYQQRDLTAAQQDFTTALSELGVSTIELELLYDTGNEAYAQIAQFLQSEWEENLPGLTVTLKSATAQSSTALQTSGDFQIAMTGQQPGPPDAGQMLTWFVPGSAANYGSYDNPAFTDLVTEATSGDLVTQAAARRAALHQAEGILLDDVGIIPLYQAGVLVLLNPDVSVATYTPLVDGWRWNFASKS